MRYLNLSSRDASIASGRRVNRPEFEGSLAGRRIGRGVGSYIYRTRGAREKERRQDRKYELPAPFFSGDAELLRDCSLLA